MKRVYPVEVIVVVPVLADSKEEAERIAEERQRFLMFVNAMPAIIASTELDDFNFNEHTKPINSELTIHELLK